MCEVMKRLGSLFCLLLLAGCTLAPVPWAYPAPDPDIASGNSRLPVKSPNEKNQDKTSGET
jgi:hypothetical protein